MSDAEPEDLVSADTAAELGRLVIVIGSIELELERMITSLFRVAPVLRPALSTGMSIRQKVDLIKAGISLSGPFTTKDEKTRFRKLLDQVTGHYIRNFIYHSIISCNEESGEISAASIRANSSTPHIKFLQLTKENITNEISELISIRTDLRIMGELLNKYFDQFESGYRKSLNRK